MKLKKFRVEVVSRYLDGDFDVDVVYVSATSAEHAEEVAFDRCGGEWGCCGNVEFIVRKIA
jgi:hypothetical protein